MALKSIAFTLFAFNCMCFVFDKPSSNEKYKLLLESIQIEKSKYLKMYKANTNKTEQLEKVRGYLINTITNEIFVEWYNTPWDFNGTTRFPKQGKIACGYFVTHTLTDLGFNIPRVKWAQSASEVFISKLANKDIRRFSFAPIDQIEAYFIKEGNGLYLVGLDQHTGFVVVKDNEINFIHASYYQPEIGVLSEDLKGENPLSHSNYIVVGKMFNDAKVLNWINVTVYR